MPARTVLLSWEGREHDPNPKDADWYWALGILAVAGTVAAILFGNYLFAVLILVASVTLALRAAQEPPIHQFHLVEEGILVGDELHPFADMVSFSVLEDIEGQYPPMLSVKTVRWLSPHLLIPLEGVDPDVVYAHFEESVQEEEHKHSVTDLVAAWLGF